MAYLIDLILEALNTDGGHHKQWYLERILKELVSEESFDIYKQHYSWEEGIAP